MQGQATHQQRPTTGGKPNRVEKRTPDAEARHRLADGKTAGPTVRFEGMDVESTTACYRCVHHKCLLEEAAAAAEAQLMPQGMPV